MTQIVRINVVGPHQDVMERLALLKGALTPGEASYVSIWCPTRWQDDASEQIDDDFEVELQGVDRRIEALETVRSAVNAVDPAGTIIRSGDYDRWTLLTNLTA